MCVGIWFCHNSKQWQTFELNDPIAYSCDMSCVCNYCILDNHGTKLWQNCVYIKASYCHGPYPNKDYQRHKPRNLIYV